MRWTLLAVIIEVMREFMTKLASPLPLHHCGIEVSGLNPHYPIILSELGRLLESHAFDKRARDESRPTRILLRTIDGSSKKKLGPERNAEIICAVADEIPTERLDGFHSEAVQ